MICTEKRRLPFWLEMRGQPHIKRMMDSRAACIGLASGAASFVANVSGVIFTLIVTAPPVGESWMECVIGCVASDPSGIFAKIFEDKETVATIEAGFHNSQFIYSNPIDVMALFVHSSELDCHISQTKTASWLHLY